MGTHRSWGTDSGVGSGHGSQHRGPGFSGTDVLSQWPIRQRKCLAVTSRLQPLAGLRLAAIQEFSSKPDP